MDAWLTLVTILFIGDSITAGVYVDPADSYPARVGEALGVGTVNAGCPGCTSRDWTEPPGPHAGGPGGGAWERLAEGIPHHGMVVLLGANDSVGTFEFWPNTGEMGWPVGAHEYGGRLIDLIERTEAPVLLVTPTKLADDFPADAHARIAAYRAAARKVAEVHERVWIGADAWALLEHPDDFADAVHPNERGLQKLADAVVGTIRANPELVLQLLAAQGVGPGAD